MIRMRRAGILPAAVLLMLCAGCATTPFAPVDVPNNTTTYKRQEGPKPDPKKVLEELHKLQKVKAPEYVFHPGDSFAIVVDGQPESTPPSNVVVLPNGAISVAPIGYVNVAGLTIPQTMELLQKKYSKFVRNCTIIIEPIKIKPDEFAISGAVNKTGINPFVFGNFRLIDALAMSGGFATAGGRDNDRYELADLENAYLMRDGKVLPVDFVEALVKRNPLHNIPIMNGDYIHIPSLDAGKIAVLGEVGDPDCYPYQPNLSLLQAIAMAGGLKETNSRDIKVIRGGLKNPVVFTLDIREIRYGRVKDFRLKPLDIVFIPRDAISEWNVLVRQILPSVQLLNGLAGPFGSPSSFLYK